MKMSWVVLGMCAALAASDVHAERLWLRFADPVGDQRGRIDVVEMTLSFESVTGEYEIVLRADPAHPFVGSFRVTVNLFDADASARDSSRSFFSDSSRIYDLDAPRTTIRLDGSSSILTFWHGSDRVATSSGPFGNPPGVSLFHSAVSDYPSGGGYLEDEDAIAFEQFTAVHAAALGIRAIKTFLDQCPDRDIAWPAIRKDFEIRRDGVLVGDLGCTEPVSAMPIEQFTDEIINAQALRVMYYMDRGMAGHLPWTAGTLYDWMKSVIGGINIVNGGSWCCSTFAGKTFINIGAQDDVQRAYKHNWSSISQHVALHAHEARHRDGFVHVSCCGLPYGCDDEFDLGNLSPYGVQWWLNKLWLDGTIDVGYECLYTRDEIDATTWWYVTGLESYAERFCANPPEPVLEPALPGGPCLMLNRRHPVREPASSPRSLEPGQGETKQSVVGHGAG